MSWLRWGVALACMGCLFGGVAAVSAQDTPTPSPDSLKNMYETLKRDQDRISSLAHDNEQLQAKVKELQKDLAASEADKSALRKQISDDAERTYFLRSFHAAWESFVSQYPDVMIRWKAYLSDDPFSGPQSDSFVDPYWPLSAKG
jgi:septal ring factor EnvC (AmiA/AmiB activator)